MGSARAWEMELHFGSGLRLARAKAFQMASRLGTLTESSSEIDLAFRTAIDSATQRVSHWATRWAKLRARHLASDWAKCLACRTDSVKGSQKESG